MDPTADPIAPSVAPFASSDSASREGWSASSASAETARTLADPGTLGIRERRSWKTWQLVGAGVLTFLIGLYIESLSHAKPAATASSTSRGAYKLPPPITLASGAAAPTGITTPATGPGGGSVTTTSTPTDSPTTTVATTGTSTVLVPRYQAQGNWTSPMFTVTGGTWNIGWAYLCTPAPASGPGFQVNVAPGGSTAVTGNKPSGQGVTPVTSTGSQTISVQAVAGCVWVVKVTGVGTP